MIYEIKYIGDIYCPTTVGVNQRYLCESVKNIPDDIVGEEVKNIFIKNLYKNCITSETKNEGIIIGVEISQQFCDYFYIVYIPSDNTVVFESFNNKTFNNTIN